MNNHASLQFTSHRPWPLPPTAWRWRQQWRELCFIHYRVSASSLRALIPANLSIQEFDGSAWISIVPFRMADVMRGAWPSIYPLRSFPELNLRTYVEVNGKPGVWFFSLDADCLPLVWGARILFGLPYFDARMRLNRNMQRIDFSSVRKKRSVRYEVRYQPTGNSFLAPAGTFEHWITERYALYSLSRQGLIRLDVHHKPWPLQAAECEIRENEILTAAGLSVLDARPIVHFSEGVDVITFDPEIVHPSD